MYRVLLLFTINFSLFTLHAQDVSFYKENITMKLEKDYLFVTGSYYLKTTGAKSILLVYPFPVDSLYGEVDSVFFFNITSDKQIDPLSIKKEAAIFKAEFGEADEILVLVSYRQKLLGNRAEYILQTTAGWHKPLEQADYQLIVPAGLEIEKFSIQPDESIDTGKERIYYWSEINYMPPDNLVFEF
jgi:hypothetical protein